jgi:hypothetical protein
MLMSTLPRLRLDQFALGGLGACATPGSTPCCGGGGCGVTICVAGCPSGTPLTANVTVVGEGSCSTFAISGGCCTVPLPDGAGTYPVAITASGYKPWGGNLALTCGGTATVTLQPSTASPSVSFAVLGCCSAALPGATITLSDGQSCTTDAGGDCDFWLGAAGTYGYTVTGPCGSRFIAATGTVTLAACVTATTSIGVGLLPATGYVCGTDGPYPLPTTLHLTDSIYGGCTLTYDPAGGLYIGTLTTTYPAQDYGPGFGGVERLCPSSSFTMTYRLFGDCGAPAFSLGATYNAIQCCRCLPGSGGFPTLVQAIVPSDVAGPAGACTADPLKCNTAILPNQANDLSSSPCVVTGLPSCPFDVAITIPQILCSGLPCVPESTGGIQPEAWTNFGGTITITE